MKLIIAFSFLFICSNVFSQSQLKPPKKRKSPVTFLHHKFNSTPSNHIGSTSMSIPEHRTCLTVEINKELREKYNLPSVERFEQEFELLKLDYLKEKEAQRTKQEVITIPVIVHVIHNGENIGTGPNISAAQVQSQIQVLNEDFRRESGTNGFNSHPDGADIEIEFALALRDKFGNNLPEPGIHRVNGNKPFWEDDDIENSLKPQTIWDPTKYLNVWTLNFSPDSNTLGYAQFPNLSGIDGLDNNMGPGITDGVVIGYKFFGTIGEVASPYDGGRTTSHEVGHWLGLYHVWGGEGGCQSDDYCEDTPRSKSANEECESNDSCTQFPGLDMIENYMDYTPDACMNIFTQNQKDRMQTVMNISPRRKELLNSTVHLSFEYPIAYFTSSRTQICSGESIDFMDNSTNTPTSWQWIFLDSDSVEVGEFTVSNPSLTFNRIGIYGLLFIVQNSNGSDTLYIPNYISVLSSDELSLPYNEDFENVNSLENWIFYNPDNDRQWQKTNVSSSQDGSNSVFMDNYSIVDGDPSGNIDALISPSIDLSTNQNVYLTFDVAYARFGGDYSDTLAVFISTDCGTNFDLIWAKGGHDLATSQDTQESFIPSDNTQWITERIPLQDFNGNSNVHIAIMNISGWGNNLYLDNISILQPSYSSPSFTIFYTPRDTVSIGNTVNFWDYSTDFPTSWSWEFEGASPSNSSVQNPSVIYNSAGNFDVKLTTTNPSGGDSWLINDFMTIVDKPTVSITSDPTNQNICEGDSITLIASGAYYYEWYDERGYLTSIEDTLISYTNISTTYDVIGYDRYGGIGIDDVQVTVNPLPEFDLGEDIIITEEESEILDVGATFSSYLWNDGTTSKTLEVSGDDFQPGTHEFYVIVTDANNCSSSDTVTVTINEVTDIVEFPFENSKFKIYPIPSNDKIFIETSNPGKNFHLYLYDLGGQLLIRKEIISDFTQLNISKLPQGVYLIKLKHEKSTETVKIIKKN